MTAALVLGAGSREIDSTLLAAAQQLGDQVALALSRAHAIRELKELNRGTLTALARAIDANSPWTAGHSERVSAVAQVIGRARQVSPEDMDRLARGGLLHDVGKIGVSADILNKPGALTQEEFERVRSHTTLGAGILAPVRAYRDLIPLVRSHHEMLDGSGYPDGLSGADIPPLVRIMTVADVFDALVSDRPYRAALSIVEAVAILRQGAGIKFDVDAVEAFLRALGSGDAEFWRIYPSLAEQFFAWPAVGISRFSPRLADDGLFSCRTLKASTRAGPSHAIAPALPTATWRSRSISAISWRDSGVVFQLPKR